VLDRGRQQFRIEAKRAGLALVKNPSSGSNQIKPVRPRCVCSLDAIVESVDQRRELDAELAHAGSGDIESFSFVFRAGEEHVLAHVRLHLPHIGRVRFKDIDGVEIDLILVLLGQLV